MSRPLILTGALLLVAAGCSKGPAIYEPSIARRPILDAVPELGEFIAMDSPAARHYLIRDIMDPADGHPARWTNQRPAMRFFLRRVSDRRLQIDFVIAHATLKDTGPLTIQFKVNDRLLDTLRYDAAGEKRFEKPVPSEWLTAGGIASASFEIDKVWIAQNDGARLGVMLLRAGFLP